MANIVEFLVKIKDLASGQMQRFANTTEGSLNRVTNRMRTVGSSIDQLNSRIDELTRTRNISLDTRQIERANREIERLENRRDALENRGRSRSGNMVGTGLVLGGLALAGAGLVTSLKAGMERQMAGTSFEVMAGKQQGNKLHGNLMGFANDTIYGNETFGEAKTLLGFGVAAKNIMPELKMLGDVAMGDKEKMQGLTLALAQTQAGGKLTGQDLLQYINAGFNPLQAMAEKTGKSMAVLKKEMSEGKISAMDIIGAFQYATGPMGRFHDGMKKMGETPTGKWMAFTGALSTAAGTIGTALLPVLGGVTTILSGLMGNEPLMYGIAAAIGAMTLAWGIYTIYTKRAAIWQGILAVAAYWPVALIGLVVGAVVWVVKAFDGWGKSINGLWTIIKAFCSNVGISFKDFFEGVLFTGNLFFLKIKDIFQKVTGMVSNAITALKLAMSGDFSGAGKALTMEIKTDASREIDKLRQERAMQKADNLAAYNQNKSAIAAGWSQVGLKFNKKAASSAMDWMTQQFDPKAKGAGTGAPEGVADTAKGISGGGVRNITIQIAKQGIDQITIHTTNLREGKDQIEQMFIDMFNQVVNSGGSMIPSN
ncbi:tape measure protein [Mucilaginibacter rubeus]|uniref:Tape measure protein n=1 Tax=Mucilaginibacter rubeus TaxID=2027860 RepID=A0A5C1I5I6_9SPHI|nr:tape measure protein [Mucilaginibacter rubeus]QEM13482.1 tape measure protein [Mucilaginibacter rubeus]